MHVKNFLFLFFPPFRSTTPHQSSSPNLPLPTNNIYRLIKQIQHGLLFQCPYAAVRRTEKEGRSSSTREEEGQEGEKGQGQGRDGAPRL